ncbi:hypothetical protein [Campylobacter showae]|jgi:hypothetical protein|uniref:hypothetical protein n=1 Tax=Campylobacter showae TaxID=204 RepID=UPI001F14445A|nr:hypothetical protein [Campylobacter showae]
MIDSQGLDAKIWVLGEAYYSIDCDYLLPAILAVSKLRAKATGGLFKAVLRAVSSRTADRV